MAEEICNAEDQEDATMSSIKGPTLVQGPIREDGLDPGVRQDAPGLVPSLVIGTNPEASPTTPEEAKVEEEEEEEQ